jgi:hypothetical protein
LRALAQYLLPSMCARVGEIERRSIVIERVGAGGKLIPLCRLKTHPL